MVDFDGAVHSRLDRLASEHAILAESLRISGLSEEKTFDDRGPVFVRRTRKVRVAMLTAEISKSSNSRRQEFKSPLAGFRRRRPEADQDLLPPDLVTLSSLSLDESSVSSVSSSERSADGVPSSPQRSIFKSYWEKEQKGGHVRTTSLAETLSSFSTSDPPSNLTGSDSNHIQGNIEKRSSTNHDINTHRKEDAPLTSSAKRREIFGGLFPSVASSSSLMNSMSSPECIRKASSTTALLNRTDRCRSCLRSFRRYPRTTTGWQRAYSDLTSKQGHLSARCRPPHRQSSVSFDPNVSIFEFDKPQERWAMDGWSDWFA